jgi:uroporphyrinogen III methyltransferase/synthase
MARAPKNSENKHTLDGRKIVLTRNKEQSVELRNKLESLGAEVLELPLIKVSPYCDPKALDDVFTEIGSYEWIVFTSRNGVQYFFDFFFKRFKDIRCIGGLRIACVGQGTAAALETYHLEVDFMPEEALSENLADGLTEFQNLENTKILVITGNLNRDILVQTLETKGQAIVDTLKVYETHLEDLTNSQDVKNFRQKGADAIVFASSSAIDSFVKQAKNLQLTPKAKKPLTCSIGPITSKTMQAAGMPIDIEAKVHTIDGIITALLDRFE